MNENASRPRDPAGFVISGILLILALVILWDMSQLTLTSVYGVGPKAMPAVVAGGLVILSVANLLMTLTVGLPTREHAAFTPILLILGGMAALIALIGLGGGFIPATAILFAATSAAFGRRALRDFLTDLAIGFGLGIVVFLLFDKVLTLSLPAGPIERLL